MKRHPFNIFSLLFGSILILLAAWIAFPVRGWLFSIPRWFLPTVVILIGAALMGPLFTSWRRSTNQTEQNTDRETRKASPAGE